jgi:glycosyltransferase involved in cell wall biosynthesis
MPSVLPQVSVVIATRGRPALLRRCLQALAEQQFAHGGDEVIVVDDGPDEATRETVAAMAPRFAPQALVYLRGGHPHGPAAARNRGAKVARAAIVAFTDDDTVADPQWLRHGVAAMQREDWAALGGRVVVPHEDAAAAPTDHERMTRGLEQGAFVTANAFVRRDWLLRIGGFDERFERAWREDSDLQFRLERGGGRVGRCEQAVVAHPVRPERWGVSLRQQKNVFFDALLYRKHPDWYRQRVRRVPPWDYYAVVAASALALALVLAGTAVAAGAAVLAAAALVARLAWRRLRGASHAPAHVWEMVATSALIPYLSVWWRLRGAWHFRTWFV